MQGAGQPSYVRQMYIQRSIGNYRPYLNFAGFLSNRAMISKKAASQTLRVPFGNLFSFQIFVFEGAVVAVLPTAGKLLNPLSTSKGEIENPEDVLFKSSLVFRFLSQSLSVWRFCFSQHVDKTGQKT